MKLPRKKRHAFVQIETKGNGYWFCTKCKVKLMLSDTGYIKNTKEMMAQCPGRPKPKPVPVTRVIKAFADLGSHGHIYGFQGGPALAVNGGQPHALLIYSKAAPRLVPCTITYEVPAK